jgi:MFS family permease
VARPLDTISEGGVTSQRLRRPTLYYGWVIIATLGITEMTSWGVLYYAFSVILTPLQTELGWSQSTITGAFSLAILASGLAAVPIGRWLDRYGPRLIMTAGSCAGVLLVLAWSRVHTIFGFYLVWFFIGITSAALFYEPAFTVTANWFRQKRAQALTLLTFGGGLASVVFVPLTEWLVRHEGWRPALLWLALILALVTIPLHALILRRHPSDMGALPDGYSSAGSSPASHLLLAERAVTVQSAVRERAFWWLSLAFSCSIFAAISVSVYLIPYLTSRGFSTPFAAAALALMGGSQIPGRLVFTPLGNRFSRRLLTAVLFAMQVVALLVLIASPTQYGVVIFAILFGSGAGASSPARAALLAERYGARHYGTINGIQAMVLTMAKAIGPIGMGALSMATGDYGLFWWALTGMAVVAVTAMLLVGSENKVAPREPNE